MQVPTAIALFSLPDGDDTETPSPYFTGRPLGRISGADRLHVGAGEIVSETDDREPEIRCQAIHETVTEIECGRVPSFPEPYESPTRQFCLPGVNVDYLYRKRPDEMVGGRRTDRA